MPIAVRIVLALLAVVVAEICALVFVSSHLGFLPTVGLLVLAGIVGGWLLRREGRRTLQELAEAVSQRRPPTRELADGVLIVAGGILILLPGLISDVAGLLLLLPPTRALVRKRLNRAAERHTQRLQDQLNAQAGYRFTGGTASGDYIDGEVVSETGDGPASGSGKGNSAAGNPRIIEGSSGLGPGHGRPGPETAI